MSLQEVSLPNGGRAWITTRPTYAQTKVWRKFLLTARSTDGTITADLSRRQAAIDGEAQILATFTDRWADVRHPATGGPLEFPAGIESMDPQDAETLFAAIVEALLGVLPSPKPSGESSGNSPTAEPSTPTT